MLAFVALVGGCAALVPKSPPATFDLEAPTSFPANVGSTGLQFAITEPTAVGALDSERIVVQPMPTEVTYLGKVQWSDRVPKLVQARLIDAFRNTGKVRSVGLPGGAVQNDIGLVTDLQDFQIDATAGQAVVSIAVRIVSDTTGRVLDSRIFTARQPVAGNDANAMVDAMNAAFQQAAVEIVVWTLARI
ncbi:ABC-type transport auxiliary lipoprotein family protein [Microbaculum marinum]|uniref:ABC-type transport auxiliary lipoprotein family protein n=1 Tax=Microbaculum marinum TaxID=1764581 RepID=A0AAW9RSK1_9HYPH